MRPDALPESASTAAAQRHGLHRVRGQRPGGHAKPGDAGTDWRQLAATAQAAKLTLVVYMGVGGAADMAQ